jgi:hypothetical protein
MDLNDILTGKVKPKVSPYGYIPETIKPESAVYNRVFAGELGAGESFDWRPFAPVRERQYWIPFCVSFSRTNCAECVAAKAGVPINFSDRELGVISGTTMSGNTLEAVSEAFRVKGVRTEKQVPFTERMLKYSGDDIWKEIFDIPPDNYQRYYGGNHSWVFGKAAMIDALKYSPLQIAVGLGETWEDEGVVKKPKNILSYHAITLLYIDAAGYMYIQDSIGKADKILEPDYPLTGVKSFRDLPENWKDTMAIIKFVHKANTQEYGFLERTAHTEIYHKAVGEQHLRVLSEVFGVSITAPDGKIDFSKAEEMQLP